MSSGGYLLRTGDLSTTRIGHTKADARAALAAYDAPQPTPVDVLLVRGAACGDGQLATGSSRATNTTPLTPTPQAQNTLARSIVRGSSSSSSGDTAGPLIVSYVRRSGGRGQSLRWWAQRAPFDAPGLSGLSTRHLPPPRSRRLALSKTLRRTIRCRPLGKCATRMGGSSAREHTRRASGARHPPVRTLRFRRTPPACTNVSLSSHL